MGWPVVVTSFFSKHRHKKLLIFVSSTENGHRFAPNFVHGFHLGLPEKKSLAETDRPTRIS
jgi:hypothetical protein